MLLAMNTWHEAHSQKFYYLCTQYTKQIPHKDITYTLHEIHLHSPGNLLALNTLHVVNSPKMMLATNTHTYYVK
jgi:hypothetical protein